MVNTNWVFSACVAHNLDAKTIEISAKRTVQGRWGFIQVKITLSKCFGYQSGEKSSSTMPF